MVLLSALAVLLLFSTVSADGTVCSQFNIVNKSPTPYYWPSAWNENQTAPEVATGQSCSWTVSVPNGFYAKLIISGRVLDDLSRFQIIDSSGNLISTTEENMQAYYLPSPKFTLVVTNEAIAYFAFKVVWTEMPPVFIGSYGVSIMAKILDIKSEITGYQYSFHTQGSVIPFVQDPANIYDFRSVLVYEGMGYGRFVSSAFQMYGNAASGTPWVSTGSALYFVNLEAKNTTSRIVLQDYQNVQDIKQYSELYFTDNSTVTRTLDAGKQNSAVIAVQRNFTLTDIQMDTNANLSVYYGSPNYFGFWGYYTGSNIQKYLPITFSGYVTQLVLSSGKAVFNFVPSL